MTARWQVGKVPTKDDVKACITNAVSHFLDNGDVDRIAAAIIRLYSARMSGKN
jgi:hypothetical protein